MTSRPRRRKITPRDLDILTALDRCPLTAEQLLKLSQTFNSPFNSPRRVRRRLQALADAGRVRRWPYATAGRGGSPWYYQLSLDGYRTLYGDDAKPPTKRCLAEIGISRHHHTRCLADFIVHTAVAAHSRGFEMINFHRENTLRLAVGDETLFPDCAFQLSSSDTDPLNFFVELDNGTERLRTGKDVDSWQRKILLYNQYQDHSPNRFRLLIVNTRSSQRLQHILQLASELTSDPNRSLAYGANLAAY